MQEILEAMVYDTPAGTADFALAAANKPAVARMYADIVTAVATLNAAGACAASILFDETTLTGRPIRTNLAMAMKKVADAQASVDEDLYLYAPIQLDGKIAIRLDKVASILWTKPNPSVALDANLGARSGMGWADTCQVTPTGVLLARTGAEIQAPAGVPAIASILDVGNARGLLRVYVANAAAPPSAIAGLHERWR